MSNLVTVNSGSAIDGSLKAGRVAISTDSTVNPLSGGKTWYNMINPAGGYVFISDPKVQGYNDGPPIIYPSQTSLPADILATINGLPDRRGSVPFDNVWDALVWVQSTGKYFILDKTLTKYPSDGLKFYFDASEISSYPKSGSIAYDLALTNEGDFTNGPVFDETDDSIYFDGADDYIDFGDVNDLDFGAESFTVAAIAYLNSADASIDYRNIVSKKVGGGVAEGWVLRRQNTDLLAFFPADGTYREDTIESTASPLDRWLFIMGWFDREAGVSRLYVGNEQKATNSINPSFNSVSSTATFQIGTWNGNTDYYKGNIAKVWAYNKSLSTEELNHLYFGAPIVTDGLVFATDAGNLVSYPKTGTTAYNLTGSNDLTLQNGLEFNSNYGGYFDSDGTNDGLDTPDASNLDLVDFTLEGWVWFNQHKNYGSLLVKGPGGSGQLFNYCFFFYQNNLALGVGDGSTFYPTYVSTDYVPTNQWNHIMGTYDGTDLKFYVNGVLRQTTSPSITPNTNTDNLNVIQTSYPIDGRVAVARVYDRALSSTEVLQNYNSQYSRFKSSRDIPKEDLVLELDAHNPDSYLSGTTWTDVSGKGNDGTLYNGPTYLTDKGGVINFDNTDDYIHLNNDLGYSTNSVSVFAWYKINGNPAGNYHIICGGQELEMSINVSHNYLRNGVYTSNGRFVSNDGNVSLNDGNYHFYGFTFDGSTKRAYIDGVQVGTQAVTGTLTTSFSNRRLGRFGSSGTYYANGNMGYYAVWNKVLSADEVMRQYTTMRPQYSVSLPRTVTDLLKLNLDAGDITSYPRTGTTWYDRSGNGNNATLYNSPTYTIAEGGVFDLDGTDDYFIAPASAAGMYNFGTDGTLEMWFRPDASYTTNHRLLCVTNNASAIDVYINPSGELRLHGNQAYATQTVPINEWTHLVVTYVGGNVQIYFNGEAQTMAGTKLTGYNITNNNQLFIGQFSGGGSYYFNGKIANTKIYHRGLNPSEVLENYKATRNRFGVDGYVTSNLQLYLDSGDIDSFDNSNTTWSDLSGNSNNATLTNGPTFNPRVGGIINFDGTNDRADNTSAPLSAGQTQYTIEAVFKPESVKTQVVWEQNTSSLTSGRRVCMILISDGDGGFNGQNADRHDQLPYYVGKYQHWVITVDTNLSTNKIKMYVNGELYDQGNPSSTLNAGADKAAVGVKVSTNSEYFDGDIPLVRVYDDVLTAAEVSQNYNSVRNRFGLD